VTLNTNILCILHRLISMEGFFLLGSLCILSSFSFQILSVDDTIPAEELFSIFEGTDVLLWVGGWGKALYRKYNVEKKLTNPFVV